jgi:GT2 family glycosyltransferase/spore maturation protein CgeB
MLDDSFLYKQDFEKHYKEFKNQDLSELYASLYGAFRLSESDDTETLGHNPEEIFKSYLKAMENINRLTRENFLLQQRVHQLGIKHRVASKLNRSLPSKAKSVAKRLSGLAPSSAKEKISRRLMPPQLVIKDPAGSRLTIDGSIGEITKNIASYMPILSQAMKLNHSVFKDSFESGLHEVQKQIPKPQIKNPPLVSIIIPTRNGLEHLRRLFNDFDSLAGYSNYEIIVVDNASTDGTAELLEDVKSKLTLSIIYNSENKSFSESNNIAAKQAKGTYLLFLNNDVSPTQDWLSHMVHTALKDPKIGAVGAKLVYPYREGFENSHKIQHGGLGFKIENGFIRPVNLGVGEGFFSRNTKSEEEKAGVTAACLLIKKSKFEEINGFEEAYWYGYEDVDLCLKLRDVGYKNVINNAAVLFHHEFGTQSKFDERTISGYRKENMLIFKNRWQAKLYPQIWQSLLTGDSIYTDKQPHVGLVVTEASEKTAAGDYMTAKELGNALEDKGWRTSYIGVRDSLDPYDIDPDIDILISMIDGYDVSKVNQQKVVKIAWCRNWFERWANHSYFRDFDIVLSNSEKAQQYFKDEHHIDSYIFKIATNKDRFTKKYAPEELKDYKSDVCFTGNYWHVPRDISSLFDADRFKERFEIKIFGKDWDHVKKLKPFWQGFLEYKNIPKVYASGKILIDDATFVVNEWGSVNSRVFDGAASGILVLTNGVDGSKNTFDGILPTFTSKEELSSLLEKYLGNDKLRQEKISEIKDYVLKHHTYEHRASQLMDILKSGLTIKTINIKLPVPRWDEAKEWGDLHFGQALQREMEKKGFNVKLQILPEWNRPNFAFANIVLRGLSVFELPGEQLNIMWNISHPEKVPLKEYGGYDYVFVASKHHTDTLKRKGLKNVYTLNQCFDKAVFNTEPAKDPNKYKSDILFVGNTRNHFRKIVRDVISWKDLDKYNFKVYGRGWEKFIDKKYIAGEHINNEDLKYYYQNTKILLNDHWDDMNKYAFVSNRLFDASACGTFIISDSNPGIAEIFGPGIIEEYQDLESLHHLLEVYLKHPMKRSSQAKKAIESVAEHHAFANRTKQMLSVVDEL